MSNFDINVDRRTDRLTDGLTENLEAGAIKTKKKRKIAQCQYNNLHYSRQSWPSDVSTTPRHPLLQSIVYIFVILVSYRRALHG